MKTLIACFLIYLVSYFGYYAVKSFQPIPLEKGQVIIGDTSWIAELGISSAFIAILLLFAAVPALGAAIKRIKKLTEGREDWTYLDEQIGK